MPLLHEAYPIARHRRDRLSGCVQRRAGHVAALAFKALRKKYGLVRVSGRMTIAQQFTAGSKESNEPVREADG